MQNDNNALRLVACLTERVNKKLGENTMLQLMLQEKVECALYDVPRRLSLAP